MTKDQVVFLRNIMLAKDRTGNRPTADTIKIILDNEHQFRVDASLVIWDDEHELLHKICANNEIPSQSHSPVEIDTTAYEQIQFIDASYDAVNFEAVLDKLSSTLKPEQKETLMKFADSIKNHATVETRPTPYFTTEPIIVPNAKQNKTRDDGITQITPSYGNPKAE